MQSKLMLEQGSRNRTCHTCKCKIPKNEYHMAVYRKSQFNWWSIRENTCVMCLEFTVKAIKHFIYKKGGMKKRRLSYQAERLVKAL